MAITYTVKQGPAVDTQFAVVATITGLENSEAGGFKIEPEKLGLRSITFGFAFMTAGATEVAANSRTASYGPIVENKIQLMDTTTGKEVASGKSYANATFVVYAFGPTRA